MTAAMLGGMLLFLALSVPVAIAIGLSGVIAVTTFTDLPIAIIGQRLFASLDSDPLIAVPLFILAGTLMERGGVSWRLVEFARSIVGGLQGGLACACVLTCMIFAAISGSGIATTFAIGSILIPAMIRHGYPAGTAAAIQASSAELGVIIPPSIPLILYGISTQVSIGELFLAAVGPGLLIGASLTLYVYFWCRYTGHGKGDREGRIGFWKASKQASLALVMPILILGGIYGGVFTPTEASAVACGYALFLGMFVYRELSPGVLIRVLQESVLTTSAVLLIIAMSGLFSYLITRSGAPAAIATWLSSIVTSPAAFLLVVNVFLLIVGMFVDGGAAIIVLAPILAPIAAHYGVDPVHFGVIVVVNLALGMVTPPFGVNLFAACMVAKLPFERIIRPLLPLVLVVLACLMIITFIPEVSLTLHGLAY